MLKENILLDFFGGIRLIYVRSFADVSVGCAAILEACRILLEQKGELLFFTRYSMPRVRGRSLSEVFYFICVSAVAGLLFSIKR